MEAYRCAEPWEIQTENRKGNSYRAAEIRPRRPKGKGVSPARLRLLVAAGRYFSK
jgi:hypothetical protein